MFSSLILVIGVILNVALMTLSERKIMGSMQRRIGPNKVGYLGFLQPFADGIKLILKETVLPLHSNRFYFLAAPFLFFFLALLNWFIIPWNAYGLGITALTEFLGCGLLILIAISELSIYGVLYSGWSAHSKYSLLGSLRSTAQMISYSISLSLILLTIIFSLGSLDLIELFLAQSFSSSLLLWPLLPISLLFLISALAECNRSPADLPEAESELVSGFMTEHSSISFAFFFLGEYSNMLLLSTLFSIFFLASTSPIPLIFFFFWVRASLPRLRFDHLLSLGWLAILPFTISFIIFLPSLLISFDILS